MNCKRLLGLVLPTAVILSACQRVSATETNPGNAFKIVNDVENYHQIVTVKNETQVNQEENFSYTATEATLFPEDVLAYGSRITKGTSQQPKKMSMYSSPEGAYQQLNQDEWLPVATTEPLFSSLEVYPYDTFVKLAETFVEKGVVTELDETYAVNYTGVDAELNQEVAALLGKFPLTNTHYEVTITVDKETQRLESLELKTEVSQAEGNRITTEELTSHFSKYNYNVPKEK